MSVARDKHDALIHQLDRCCGRRDGYLDRVIEVLLGEGRDRPRHGRRKQQCLPLSGQQLHDLLQRMDEAEVEHPVGFVEDQDLDIRQGKGLRSIRSSRASRGGNEDVDARRQLPLLGSDRDAAETTAVETGIPRAIGAETFRDLARQLSGGAEHKRPAGAGACVASGTPERRCRIGNAKAAVLPVPVWAMPQRSRPLRTFGMAWIGIGVGVA